MWGPETQFPVLLLLWLTREFLIHQNICFILSKTTKVDMKLSQHLASFNTLPLSSP